MRTQMQLSYHREIGREATADRRQLTQICGYPTTGKSVGKPRRSQSHAASCIEDPTTGKSVGKPRRNVPMTTEEPISYHREIGREATAYAHRRDYRPMILPQGNR